MLSEYAVTREPALRNLIAEQHLPLVKFVARRLSSSLPGNVELDDLVADGSIGLLDAIEKFEPQRGHQFSTYAVTRIRGAMLDGMQKMDWAPKQVTSKVRQMRRLRETLTNELGREPSVIELAERMEVSAFEIRGWLNDDQALRVKPLAPPQDSEDSRGYTDAALAVHGDQDVAGEATEIRRRVAMAVSSLPEREQQVFLLYYRDNMTLKEIAECMGCSVSSATQTRTRLVEHVKERLAAYGEVA